MGRVSSPLYPKQPGVFLCSICVVVVVVVVVVVDVVVVVVVVLQKR